MGLPRVLEIESSYAVALAACHLRDLGCVTTRWSTRTSRHPHMRVDATAPHLAHWLNAGKREPPPSLEAALDGADVVLVDDESAMPVHARQHPRLVVIVVPPFMEQAEEEDAYEEVVMAASGVFGDMGLNRTLRGIDASYTHLAMASTYASMCAALAALGSWARGVRGERAVVPMGSCVYEMLVHNTMELHPQLPDVYLNAREREARDGASAQRTYEDVWRLLDPFFCHYWAADGRPLYIVCPCHLGHQQRLLSLLDIDHFDLRIADAYGDDGAFGLGTQLDDVDAARVRDAIAARIRTANAVEWEQRIQAVGVPAVAHRTAAEWAGSAHARESGLCTIDDEGRIESIGPAAWLHRRASCTPSDVSDVLSGVRVVDMCNVIAGPTIGTMLARFGADVIKIDAPTPSYSPHVSVIYGLATNAGKRSVLLDAHRGRAELHALLRDADVLLLNCTAESQRRLGLDEMALCAIAPRLVVMRFDAYGGPCESGPMSDYVGYDDNLQAALGIQERFGGGLDTVEEHAHVGTIDVVSGVAGALGTIAALLKRTEGIVCTARCSLASVGQYLHAHLLCGLTLADVGARRFCESSLLGADCKERRPGHGCYHLRDGWCLLIVPSLARLLNVSDEDAARALLPLSDCQSVRSAARACGGVCVPLLRVRDVGVVSAHAEREGSTYQMVRYASHPTGGEVTMAAPVAMRGSAIRVDLPPSPKYGAHTRELIGTEPIVHDRAGISWSRCYLPYYYPISCEDCGAAVGANPCSTVCQHAACESCWAPQICHGGSEADMKDADAHQDCHSGRDGSSACTDPGGLGVIPDATYLPKVLSAAGLCLLAGDDVQLSPLPCARA